MKKIKATLPFLALISLMLTEAANSAQFESKIDAVTLYTSGALITRTSAVQLSAGEQELRITGFPSELDGGSVRIRLSNSEVTVGQISTQEVNYVDAQDPEVRELTQQLESLGRDIQIHQDKIKSANLQLKFLESLAEGYGKQAWAGSAQGRADTAGWQQALNLMQNGSSNAFEALRRSNDTLKELNKERTAIQNTLNNKNKDAKASTTVLIALNTPRALNTTAIIQYLQEDATWAPAYEARLDTSSGRLVLAQKAVVEQYTQEEWPNVKLTLSTSRPSEEAQVPEVNSEFYTLAEPISRSKLKRSVVAAPVYSADAPQFEEIVVTGARRSNSWSGRYALSFPVAGRVNVSNDQDQSQRYDLQSFEFDSKLVTQIAPTESEQAFLAARFTHEGSVPLYGSEMQVFVDGIFSGEADMPAILPGKEITLPMGQDPRIEVRVVDLGARNAESGLIKKVNTKAEDVVYEVTNRRPATADIEVRSAFPVSKHKSVKIKIGDDTTPPNKEDANEQTGVALWEKSVAPNETWKIRYQVTISYPADRQLQQSYR